MIKVTDFNGNVTIEHTGEVVDVRRSRQQRNVSDTLDYSDYRFVDVTEALVWVGRTDLSGNERSPIDRFKWIDCSNLFVWRGQSKQEPTIDVLRHPDVVIDYCNYLEASREAEQARVEEAKKQAIFEAERKEEEERNRPVRGKKMVAVSGRKKGHVGTVAYIAEYGVLLKADSEWQNRQAPGVWVKAQHLKACKQ